MPAPEHSFETYVHPDGLWSIDYPAGWKVEYQPSSEREYVEFRTSGFFADIKVIRDPGSGSLYDLDSWTSSSLSIQESINESYQLISLERVTVGGRPANEAVFFTTYATTDFADIVLYLVIGEDTYQIRGTTTQDTWDDAKEIFRQSVYTFRSPP